VAASRQAGASVSAVALANGLNANLLRRWIKESAERGGAGKQLPIAPARAPMTVVPVTIEAREGGEEIRIDIRRDGLALQLAWPATRTAELGGLLKELLR